MRKVAFFLLCFLCVINFTGCFNSSKKISDEPSISKNQFVETDKFTIEAPDNWKVNKQADSSLIFQSNSNDIGGVNIITYDPTQPLYQLYPNHSELVSSEKIDGLASEAYKVILKLSQPAASQNQSTKNEVHFYFLLKDKNESYDLFFDKDKVDDNTALAIAKSLRVK
jgi:hypothetical protein